MRPATGLALAELIADGARLVGGSAPLRPIARSQDAEEGAAVRQGRHERERGERGAAPSAIRASSRVGATDRAATAQMQFQGAPIVDQQQVASVLGTITVPQNWNVTSGSSGSTTT